MTIFYPDLSNYDHGYVIPAGTPAVVAKATEGIYYHDASYLDFKAQAAKLGVPFSGYHFLKSESSPEAQAAYYHDFAGNVPCMLDVEEEGGSRPGVDWCVRFIAALHKLGGRAWAAYYPKWYLGLTGGNLALLGVPVISSAYVAYSDTGDGWLPYGGITPAIWQYTSSPHDRNAFKGTAAQLADLINGEIVTPADLLAIAQAVYNYGSEDVTLADGTVVHNTPLGNLAHGAHVALIDPVKGLQSQFAAFSQRLTDIEIKLNLLSNPNPLHPTAQEVAAETLSELKAKL